MPGSNSASSSLQIIFCTFADYSARWLHEASFADRIHHSQLKRKITHTVCNPVLCTDSVQMEFQPLFKHIKKHFSPEWCVPVRNVSVRSKLLITFCICDGAHRPLVRTAQFANRQLFVVIPQTHTFAERATTFALHIIVAK